MKLCIQTENILDKRGVEEGFRMIREAGFDSVDFNIDLFYSGKLIAKGEPSDYFSRSDDDIRRDLIPVKEAAAANGIAIHQMHAPFPFYVENECGNGYALDAARKCIMAAGFLNCPYLIVHPNFLHYDQQLSPEVEWKINLERYGALIEDCKKYHVTVCLENMFTLHGRDIYTAICSDMNESAHYIDALNEMAGEKCFAFCLDTGHAMLLRLNLRTVIRQLGHRLETLHIHDNDGVNDQHLAPYMGIIDWNGFCQGLKEIGYKGALSFETYNALNVFDPELHADVLGFIAKTGRIFARRIEG